MAQPSSSDVLAGFRHLGTYPKNPAGFIGKTHQLKPLISHGFSPVLISRTTKMCNRHMEFFTT